MMQQQNAPVVVAQVHRQDSVLLRLGDSDESLYYQAAVGMRLSVNSAMIELHDSSIMLERLRTHGTLSVFAQLHDGTVYRARLMLLNNRASVQFDELCDEIISAPRLLPLT